MASLHSLVRKTARPARRIGRGQSSGAGKTSGRGTKGQNARAGRKKRPELRDLIKKLPKRRGWGKNRGRTVYTLRPKPVAITFAALSRAFDAGTEITPKLLVERGLLKQQGTSMPAVKIVGTSENAKKFTFKGVTVSSGAKSEIERTGGTLA